MWRLTAASLIVVSIALPVMAQSPATHAAAAANAPATAGNPTGRRYPKQSERNAVMTGNGGMRASKMIGSSVYNDHDQKIGSIDDLVIGNDKALHAVVSVGGFLGMDSKLVEVPFD